MGIRISLNKAHIIDEINQEDLKELDKIKNLECIQIWDYLSKESLIVLDEYIIKRNKDIQFRIYGFIGTICDLKFLKYLKNIRNLSIDAIRTVEGLDNLRFLLRLEKLKIKIDNLFDLEFLNYVNSGLDELSLGTERILNNIDLSLLKRFRKLKVLFLYKINDDYHKLISLKNLEKLTFKAINLPNLSFISQTNIKELSIGHINNCVLDQLKGNNQLTKLELNNMLKIKNIDVIKDIPNLFCLKINQLRILTAIPDLKNNQFLESIYIKNMNKLTDIKALEFVPNLKYLEINKTRLLEVADLRLVLNNKNLIKAKCLIGGAKKEHEVRKIIKEKGLE